MTTDSPIFDALREECTDTNWYMVASNELLLWLWGLS
jgi:hypothetical protein